uniref:G-protein coupled receptors family 1 profile domain-containing protein n=1 Tax=Lates calcarifer TaxID=8187 RepID=A0A4W6CMJ4_LATCA
MLHQTSSISQLLRPLCSWEIYPLKVNLHPACEKSEGVWVISEVNVYCLCHSCLYYKTLVCKIQNIFDVTLSTASILNLCFISIDRYYAVCQPLTYRTKINADSAVVMILVTWSFSILIGITLYIVELKLEICQEMCLLEIFLLNALAPFFAFYLPLIIMLCIYLKIFLVAQRQARSIHNTNCQSTKSGATVSKMERKATKTLATVLGAFLMCWLPYFLCYTIQFFSFLSLPVQLLEALMCFALSNSMFNPFIYALFYSWFRSAFRMIISGKIFQGDFSNTKLWPPTLGPVLLEVSAS